MCQMDVLDADEQSPLLRHSSLMVLLHSLLLAMVVLTFNSQANT